jgi:hypothetical protein
VAIPKTQFNSCEKSFDAIIQELTVRAKERIQLAEWWLNDYEQHHTALLWLSLAQKDLETIKQLKDTKSSLAHDDRRRQPGV